MALFRHISLHSGFRRGFSCVYLHDQTLEAMTCTRFRLEMPLHRVFREYVIKLRWAIPEPWVLQDNIDETL